MKQYEFDGSISMKSNGVMLTHGFYIPDYLFETYPTAAVYAKWKDPDWRQYIVNATWSQQVLDVNRSMNKPMIWHSLASYIDSQQMEKMNDYHDLDLHFNYSGSETSNTERLLGLYNASVPFICYSYSPMLLPALISLQRVYFPDNPTGMYDDECMSEGRCDMPDDAYRVLWRTDAMTRSWTEVQMFLMRFHLDRGKVESVIGIAYKYSANNTDDFFQATCQWLKNNTATWNDWIVPIQRWKCGANGELCATESVSSLQVTIYGLSGIITVLLVVWIMYKLVGFCKEFQEAFVNTDVDESNALIQKEKRRIMISIFTDVAALSISVIDFVTDVIALLAILVLYFLLTLFAAFACTAHMVVTAEPLINNDDNDNDAEMANNEATTTTTSDNKDGDDTERKPKRSPNRLMVDDVSEVVQGDGDNSCVLLSVCKMEGKALHIHNTSYLSTDAKSHHDTKKRIYRIEQSNQRLQQQQMTDVHCVCVCVVYN